MDLPSSLESIATAPPVLPCDVVARHVQREYGLAGELSSLISERDQNFALRTPAGAQYVVKVANPAEERRVTEFQIRALQHLGKRRCPVVVPRVIAAQNGAALTQVEATGTTYGLRIVTWLPGLPLEGRIIDPTLAYDIGHSLADLDAALADFRHPGDTQSLLWDMQRAAELEQLMGHIGDRDAWRAVASCLEDFEVRVMPMLAGLRQQVIHNDLNPGNVLVSATGHDRVAGVIDFGDMVRAPLVVDVAIACSYVREFGDNPLAALASLVAGFDSVTPLEASELELLYDLIRTRLAATITILNWRAAARGEDDAYLRKTLAESTAERFLDRIDAIPRSEFLQTINDALKR